MSSDQQPNAREGLTLKSFFLGLANGMMRDLFRLIAAVGIGTGIGAGVCLYYGVPLIFSFVGAFVVLGVVVLLLTDA